MKHLFILMAAFAVAGCQTGYDSLAYGPSLTPVGHGLQPQREALPVTFTPPVQRTFRSTWNQNSQSMYGDIRATKVGDTLTVAIAIDDKAEFDNQTDRSRNGSSDFGFDTGLNLAGFGRGVNAGAASGNFGVSNDTSTKGKGTIDRSEKLRINVAAVVTEVLPNGNLLISGSQETQVNFELRVLNIQGIVNPLDISSNNIIPYDRIAEARVTYGGRGRLTDVQQPAWGQRLFDAAAPW
ncbi:flagellar basal body L-ring protein FlgH [Aquabacter cavernae]|uniref:flagellar basal body L-ring protein FlgH n=1 Tax=Aquabacter cavernae TaxID=2496029 RepID=UPI000F8CDF0A|nr:flagellar basal body L-ring protein FlgH [Aquabacter cavernae]